MSDQPKPKYPRIIRTYEYLRVVEIEPGFFALESGNEVDAMGASVWRSFDHMYQGDEGPRSKADRLLYSILVESSKTLDLYEAEDRRREEHKREAAELLGNELEGVVLE